MLEGVKSTSIRDVARRAAGDETDEDEERVSETASERSSVLFSLWEDKETRKTRRKSEEINSYYAGRFGFGKYYLEFPPKVLCNVRRQNKIRRLCIHLVRQTWFDVVILCLIVVNAFLMAFYDPVDERLGIESTANSVIQNSEWGFQTVFTIEAIIKIVALGLFPYPSGYLREGWNILDFCIVVAGWVPLLVGGTSMGENSVDGSTTSSLTILRFARILRPLRALRIFPSLNKLVRAILNAASQVAEVLVLCSAILFVFALVGLTLFKGNLRQRCALLEPTLNEWIIPVSELESFCSMEPHLYGRTCPAGLTCIYAGFNPDNELVSFDNFYLSLLTVFQVITLEGWSTVMFGLFDTVNKVHGLFFIFLVLFGAYFMTNLLVSALSVNYMLVRRQAEQEEALRAGSAPLIDELVKQEEQKGNSLRGFQSLSLEKQVQLMEMRLMFEYEKHCHQPTYTVVSKTMYETYRSRVNQAAYARWRKRFRSTQAKRIRDQANLALAQVKHKREVFSKERPESTEFMDAESSLHKILGNTSFATVADVKQQPARRRGASGDSELSASSHFFDANGVEEDASLFSARARALGQGQDQDQDADSNNAALETAPRESRASSVTSHSTKSNIIGEAHALIKLNRERSMKEQRDRSSSKAPIGATMRGSPVQRFVYQRITSTRWFTVLVFCLILLNTIFLALEHFEQPASWFVMLNVVNIVLLALFAVEMILRMVAEGLRFYFQSGFNILDFVIVVGGFVQLFLGDQVLSVLRALRFLRFLRLANHWTTLNHLLESIQITIVHVSPFLVFLAIVMYILTISGLQFFGGSFTIPQTIESSEFVFANDGSPVNGTLNINAEFDCTPYAGKFLRQLKNGTDVLVCPTRTNYDNFLWSFVATFQVISGDDWNSVMVQATEQTESYWPVVYYVFVVLFGSFLVLNFFSRHSPRHLCSPLRRAQKEEQAAA